MSANSKPAPRIVGVDQSKNPTRYHYQYRGLDGQLKTLRLDDELQGKLGHDERRLLKRGTR